MGDYGGGGYSPAAGGGTLNTGNAAVGDVAIGKTFSSAVLTNATGTSTKDATVGGSANIQPPQAFVDNISKYGDFDSYPDIVSAGVTFIAPSLITQYINNYTILEGVTSGPPLNYSGNAITNVSAILAAVASLGAVPNGSPGAFNFSGGTNAEIVATNSAAWLLALGHGWVISFRLHNVTVQLDGASGPAVAHFEGNSMSSSEVNDLLAFLAVNYPSPVSAWVLNITGGTNGAPTGQGIDDAQSLRDGGQWTVTTN